jgi:hypothetical protein
MHTQSNVPIENRHALCATRLDADTMACWLTRRHVWDAWTHPGKHLQNMLETVTLFQGMWALFTTSKPWADLRHSFKLREALAAAALQACCITATWTRT